MTAFPQSAAYGKKIPFATLRRQGIAPRYGDFIKSLVWAYKLSPETMQLAATDSVREIEVMDLAVKDKCSGLRSLAAVISALDKIIPSPLIFRVFDEEGRALKIAFNLKTSGGGRRHDDISRRITARTGSAALSRRIASRRPGGHREEDFKGDAA